MATHPVELSRAQILAFRRRVSGLDERLPPGPDALGVAAWAGLQDSMPRAALLSIHARVEETAPDDWAHPSLVQLWGPRFNAYVVAERDRAVFTLGRMSDDPVTCRAAEELADRLAAFLDGRQMTYEQAGRELGMHPNGLRYAAPTGRVVLRWDGAGRPTIWMVPAPDVDRWDARRELARRYLHVFGPSTAERFAEWAGVAPAHGRATFEALAASLLAVRTPVGDAWILGDDLEALRDSDRRAEGAPRLLPSGDTYCLLWGVDRDLLVPDPDRRRELWPSRVWPGAVLIDGEAAGTWRRAGPVVTIATWRPLPPAVRDAVEAETQSLPLPNVQGRLRTRWS